MSEDHELEHQELEQQELAVASGSVFRIRPMTVQDLEAIQSIEERVQSHPWRPAHFSDCLKAGNVALVVEQPDAPSCIAAYAIVTLGGREADLLNVAVAPDYRRQGIASQLLDYLVAQIADRADNLFLEVRASNRAAINLYENLGFNQVGVRPNYYPARQGREDALILALSLE